MLVALAAGPIVAAAAARPRRRSVAVGARMLRVFAPQLPLYGIGIVLTGVLQAHRRFAWPVLAPLLSSVTVIGAYLAFAAGRRAGAALAELGRDRSSWSWPAGTTARAWWCSSLCLLIPLRRLRLRLRPALRFARRRGAAVRRAGRRRRGHGRRPAAGTAGW